MENKIIGPVLPENLLAAASNEVEQEQIMDCGLYGPQLPQHLIIKKETEHEEKGENDDDDFSEIIGPLPACMEGSSLIQKTLNERAGVLKYKFDNQIVDDVDEPPKREAWMTELPPENTQLFGLGSRKFKPNSNEKKPGRSLWTDAPNSKRKQETADEADFFEKSVIEKRNKDMDEIVKRSKKHKKEKKTLLELHRDKLKKKKKKDKDEERLERRPFDRDSDLQTNRFDAAQKRSIISKAKLLDSRFKAGHSKYL